MACLLDLIPNRYKCVADDAYKFLDREVVGARVDTCMRSIRLTIEQPSAIQVCLLQIWT